MRTMQKTIVSITPINVAADSRTFKIAASFTRFGYRSIVLEGGRSDLDLRSLPFELLSLGTIGPVRQEEPISLRKKTERLLKKYLKKYFPERLHSILRGALSFRNYTTSYVLSTSRAIPPASLYYLHAPYQFPAVYWKAKRYGAPIIYDAHDFYSVLYQGSHSFYKRLERWCISKSAVVVTVSDGVARLMEQEFGCQPIVVRNCQDGRLQKNSSRRLRDKLGLPSDAFLLVTIGTAKNGQAVTEALAALAALPRSVHIAFVGAGYEQYLGIIEKYGLKDRAHPVSPVRPDEVVSFIRGADVALILYYSLHVNYENCLPNGFFQSVSAHLPLLYPELPEIRKISEEYKLGFPINPLSIESIKTGVNKFLQNPGRLREYKENSQRASQMLSWEQEEEILQGIVYKVLKPQL